MKIFPALQFLLNLFMVEFSYEFFSGEQHTVGAEIELFGKGLFTGEICTVLISPAPPDTGIVFRKEKGEEVKVSLATTEVGFRNLIVRTPDGPIFYTEHLLSAFFALGVDNVVVSVWGDEIPFFDGSALVWSERIQQVGLKSQKIPRKIALPSSKFHIKEGDGEIFVKPSGKFEVFVELKRKNIPYLTLRFDNISKYSEEIAPARTFATSEDAKLAPSILKGFSEDSTVVFENGKPKTKLIFPDEPARHKVLDFLGDLYSLGIRLLASFHIKNPSHTLTRKMLETIDFEVI